MSAEQRRRSAPKSDAAATSAIGDGAAVRGGGEASPAGHVVRGAGHWLMGWAELGFWVGTSLGLWTTKRPAENEDVPANIKSLTCACQSNHYTKLKKIKKIIFNYFLFRNNFF